MIPFNDISQSDRTMKEINWGVEGRLRMRRLDSVLAFLLMIMMGGAISKHGHLIIPRLTRVFQYEDNHHKLDQLMEILKSNCTTRAHQEGQDLYCSIDIRSSTLNIKIENRSKYTVVIENAKSQRLFTDDTFQR